MYNEQVDRYTDILHVCTNVIVGLKIAADGYLLNRVLRLIRESSSKCRATLEICYNCRAINKDDGVLMKYPYNRIDLAGSI
jgi:hypothetical protein